MPGDHYDVLIVGSGPGGATMAWRLAQTGKRILLIERGDYLPRERENWDTDEVFRKARYQADETWTSSSGDRFKPGPALLRWRQLQGLWRRAVSAPGDRFRGVRHPDGITPEWPVKYDVFEPYYQAAEELFQVHGARGEDPTEPRWTRPYPRPAITHEPRIRQLSEGLTREGLHPFHLPLGALMDEDGRGGTLPHSPLLRCDPFDGYPSLTNGKADAQIMCVDPALNQHPNLTLLTNAYVEKVLTCPSGRSATGVEAIIDGARQNSRPTLSSLPAARCPRRCCFCGRRTTPIQAASPTGPTRSGATTCATTMRWCLPFPRRRTRRNSRKRWASMTSIMVAI